MDPAWDTIRSIKQLETLREERWAEGIGHVFSRPERLERREMFLDMQIALDTLWARVRKVRAQWEEQAPNDFAVFSMRILGDVA